MELSTRLGLCCAFSAEPIKFRTTTARHLSTLRKPRRRRFLGEIALHNATALEQAVEWCGAHGVGAFRVTSDLLPTATHPRFAYRLDDVDPQAEAEAIFRHVKRRARSLNVRLSFHPDQFIVPGSLNPEVVRKSLEDLELQAGLAQLIGAEQLTLHGGGAQEGKAAALARLARGLDRLSPAARRLVVLENDDRLYTPEDLLPFCRTEGLPFLYDVHHHRCLPDSLSLEEVTAASAATWKPREPWAHLSSPSGGWSAPNPRHHSELIRPSDFPKLWLNRRMTVDIEARGKERAVLRLRAWLQSIGSFSPRNFGSGRASTISRASGRENNSRSA
jgi:UV DNA damage endonuclease